MIIPTAINNVQEDKSRKFQTNLLLRKYSLGFYFMRMNSETSSVRE